MVCLAPEARVEALVRVADGVVDPAEQAEARLGERRGVAVHFRRCRTVGLKMRGRLEGVLCSPEH